jgi:hypothetical protein
MIYVMTQVALGEGGDKRALLYLVPILISGEVLLLRVDSKRPAREEREAGSLMGDQCTGVRFVGFKREPKGVIDETPVDIFQFSNREYASQFCELNGGKLE